MKPIILLAVCSFVAAQAYQVRLPITRRIAYFYYRGKCQSGVANFPFSTPSAAAPSFTCVNTGSAVTAVASWAANTSNQTVQDQFPLPPGFAGDMAVEVFGRSADATHTTTLSLAWACVGADSIDNPAFTGIPPIHFTGASPNGRTVVGANFTAACAAGQDFYWKLTGDTTALNSDATFDLIALRFSTAALQ